MNKLLPDFISSGDIVPDNIPHFAIRPVHYFGENNSTVYYDHDLETTGAFRVCQHNSNGTEKCLADFKINLNKTVKSENFTEPEALSAYWKACFYAESRREFALISTGASYENVRKLRMSAPSQKIFHEINKTVKKRRINTGIGR